MTIRKTTRIISIRSGAIWRMISVLIYSVCTISMDTVMIKAPSVVQNLWKGYTLPAESTCVTDIRAALGAISLG